MTDTLPIEIQRTILDGLEPIAQSFVYAIANSTALGSEGQVIPYAVDLTKDSNAWFFNVLKETQEGRESIEECVNTHYDELLKLLSGIHQDYWDYDDETDRSFLQEHWRDCAGDYLEYTSLEDYHKDKVIEYDLAIKNNSKEYKSLSWEDISVARKKGSYVANQLANSLNFGGLLRPVDRIIDRCLSHHKGLIQRDEQLSISPHYIGGNRYDVGAKAVIALIEQHATRNKQLLSQATDFLAAQGYLEESVKLHEMLK